MKGHHFRLPSTGLTSSPTKLSWIFERIKCIFLDQEQTLSKMLILSQTCVALQGSMKIGNSESSEPLRFECVSFVTICMTSSILFQKSSPKTFSCLAHADLMV